MYVNKCIKCGAEFETKNPKRVICPNCLYADKGETQEEKPMQSYSSYNYATEQRPRNNDRQQGGYRNNNYNRDGQRDYNRDRNQGGYQRRDNNNRGGYQQRRPDGQRDNRNGGFRNNYASGGRNNGNFQRRPNPNKRPKPQKQAKPLLISKEQLEQIEAIYKAMLPLPNPDVHEVIGATLGIEPQKVFFGINLVRQKLMLPKLPFPKRKLAISPDQLLAIKSLYEPLLPLPPIGCHKIIAAQLKMDEWRVHVGIKLVRSQLGLDRWNEDRKDKPADYMVVKHAKQSEPKPIEVPAETAPTEAVQAVATTEDTAAEAVVQEKPKRGRKPKKKEDEE
ncbi:MAG: hypothetical protein E7Z89_05490 [Cyanobacteria bacterium SIG28]|nr:hypothetical protein [Cyanobacteria bacterium SIG28]